MKKLYYLGAALLIFSSFNAQNKKKDAEFIPVEITKENGETENVLLRGVYSPRHESYVGVIGQSYKPNSMYPMNLHFEYKNIEDIDEESDKKPEIKKIKFNDLKKIRVLDYQQGDIVGYEKLKILEFDSDMKLGHKNYEILAPILYEGKINMYGFDLYINNFYMSTLIYLKKDGDPYAVMPIDYDRNSILKMKASSERFIKSLRQIGGKCTPFSNYIDELEKKFEKESVTKEMARGSWEYSKKVRNENKETNVPLSKRRRELDKGNHDYTVNYIQEVIDVYEKNCSN